jgi:prepilin-type N-terminal cleavage/methylation domain-containing protein
MHPISQSRRAGFTIIEVVTVLVVIGIVVAIAMPRMRVSPERRVETAARQLARDLELARTRALSARRQVRVAFDPSAGTYIGYLDHDRDQAFDESVTESRALMGLGERELSPEVRYGRGSAGPVPVDSTAGAVTFAGNRMELNTRGVLEPFGSRGTIYFVHRDLPAVVAAVSVSGSASVQVWTYRGGQWQ